MIEENTPYLAETEIQLNEYSLRVYFQNKQKEKEKERNEFYKKLDKNGTLKSITQSLKFTNSNFEEFKKQFNIELGIRTNRYLSINDIPKTKITVLFNTIRNQKKELY